MVWQDIVIAICAIAFSYALIPQILKGFRSKKSLISTQTTIITTIGMFMLALTYLTPNLIFSAIITFIATALWTILLIQNKIYKN